VPPLETPNDSGNEGSITGLTLAEAEEKATQQVLDDIHADAAAAAGASDDDEFGRVGPRFDRRSPFFIGFVGALGVACAFALSYIVVAAGQILVLIGVAFFFAVGLDPAVRWLHRRGIPRSGAIALVLLAAFGVFGLFVALAVPLAVTQASHLANDIPSYLTSLKNHHSTIGKLNSKYHIISRLQKLLKGSSSFKTILGGGMVVVNLIGGVILVGILSVYMLVDLPRVKRAIYRLAPRSRRARAVLLTDEIIDRVGGYVLGDIFTSLIAGVGTLAWVLALGVPYGAFLALLVALLDLIPIIGSTIGGIIVSLVALTVSLQLAVATAIFYFVYRFLEDYLITPRVMARTVAVPGLVTVIATIIGGALLGIVGALVAIPIAAAVKLLLDEVAAPSLEKA
jgi:predicted PurR-regulated permease PerM